MKYLGWIVGCCWAYSVIENAEVFVDDSVVRRNSEYLISFIFAVPAGGSAVVGFPDSFLMDVEGFSCFLSGVQCGCEYYLRNLSIAGCFTSASVVQVKIKNFTNPLYAGLSSFKLYIYDSSQRLSGSNTNSLKFQFDPEILECDLSLGSDIAAQYSSWNLIMAPKYPLSPSNQIIIEYHSNNCFQALSCLGLANRCECTNEEIIINILENLEGLLNVTINYVQNPSSTAQVSRIFVKITENQGVVESSNELSVKVNYGAELDIGVVLDNSVVYENSSYYIEFKCDNTVPANSDISLDFPSDLTLFPSTSINGIFGVNSFLYYSILLNNVSITNCVDSDLSPNQTIALEAFPIQNPKSTKPIQGYIKILYSEHSVCEGQFYITPSVGSLNVAIQSTNSTINQLSNYTFLVSSEHIWTDSCIYITFPAGFYISTENCEDCLNSSTIRFGRVSGNYAELGVEQVRNPGFTYPTELFIIESFVDCDASYSIELNNSVFITLTPGFCEPKIELSSYITGDYSSYSFSILITNTMPAYSDISINFPSEIQVTNLKTTLKNPSNLSSSSKLLLTTNSLTISKANSSPFQGLISFTIQYIKNPSSLKPSTITCYTLKDSYYIDYNKIELTMKTPHGFKYTKLVMGSYIVGQATSFYLELFPYNLNFNLINLEFGYDIGDVYCDLNCSFDQVLRVPHESDEVSMSFTIFNITNPPNTAQWKLSVKSEENGYLSDSDTIDFSAYTPGSLEVSTNQSNPLISSLNNISFLVTPSNSVPWPGVLQLKPANPSVFCASSMYSCDVQDELVRIEFWSNLTGPFWFSLLNFTNYEFSGIHGFELCSLDGEDFVDCGNFSLEFGCEGNCRECEYYAWNCSECYSGAFLFDGGCRESCLEGFYKSQERCEACRMPCEKCVEVDKCESCVSEFPYYWIDFCYNSCPSSTFPDSNYNCTSCPSPCSECSSFSTCTSCLPSFFLHQGSCLSTCPSSYFAQDQACFPCPSNCESCTNSQTCSECESSYLLYNHQCQDKCPEGITVPVNGICEACTYPCQTCEITPTDCTSCLKYLLFNGTCIGKCPKGFFDYINTCQACSSKCFTCSGDSLHCESCGSGLVLYNNNCLESCPVGLVNVSGKCACFSGCDYCDSSGCIKCSSKYFLYNSTCVLECPKGYFGKAGSCIECIGGCEDCDDLDHCVECSTGLVLFNDNCLTGCPNGTYVYEEKCFSCQSPCIECVESPLSCTICESPYLLFNYSCVSSCPSGYSEYYSKCVADSEYCTENCTFAMSKNSVCDWSCYVKACNFDNDKCPPANYSDTLAITEVPVPISITGGVGAIAAGVSSVVSGSSFIAVANPVCSLLETAAGLGLMSTVSLADGTRGRSTLDTSNSDIMAVFFLLFIINTLHVLGNLSFIFIFYKWILPSDSTIRSWYQSHNCAARTILILCGSLSYKFFKISSSKVFNLKSCSLPKLHHRSLWTTLMYLDLFTLFILEFPLLGICIYIFFIFSQGSYTYIVALDSSIIISFVILITLYDLITLKRSLKTDSNKPPPKQAEATEVDHKSYIEDLKSKSTINSQRTLNYYWREENNATDIITE